jgi:hypothetical protein
MGETFHYQGKTITLTERVHSTTRTLADVDADGQQIGTLVMYAGTPAVEKALRLDGHTLASYGPRGVYPRTAVGDLLK